jgi:membrane fusion protein, multidrug efflux system
LSETKHRVRGWLVAVSGIALVFAVAGYGIWTRGVAMTDLQQQTVDSAIPRVEVTMPKPGPTERTVTLPGDVVAWNEAPIYAQVSGYVTKWYKDYGAHVEQGELLAEIDAPGLDAQYKASLAQLDMAQANYNLSTVTAKRYTELKGTAGVSQQQIDNVVAAAAAEKAKVAAAQENVQRYNAMIGFEKIAAPFAGTVTARLVNVGDYVTSTGGDAAVQGSAQPLFHVADVSKLRVYVDVPQSYANVLSPAIEAALTLPNAPEKPIKADFLTTAGAVRTDTRTIVTELVVEDGQKPLLPGAYVEVHLTVPGPPNLLIVPSQALLFRAEGMQVATVGAGDRVHLQDVSLGDNLGSEVEVRSGLTATDKIVANPSLGLLEGERVKITQATDGYEMTETTKPAEQPPPSERLIAPK